MGIKLYSLEYKKLGEVCEFKRGQTITKKDVILGEVPVVAGGQKPAYYHNMSNRQGITIAVSGSGAYAGYVSYWDRPIFLSDAFSIEPIQDINKRYLYYFLLSLQNKIYELKKGSGIPHVYSSDLISLNIIIPPVFIQEHIVSILDKFEVLINNLSQGLPKEIELRKKQYEYYREKLLNFDRAL